MMGLVIHSTGFQSTLPRRERRELEKASFRDIAISIHAPAKGATFGDYPPTTEQVISIHAPAKGATMNNYDYTFSGCISQYTLKRWERREGGSPIPYGV